jgi:acyl-coenzyme A synthetase/AMP-(fatty) acid ligase
VLTTLADMTRRVPDPRSEGYVRVGVQTGKVVGSLLGQNRRDFATHTAVIDGAVELSWGDLVDAAARFAGFLTGNGVHPGDVVSWQLPNWWEAVVVGHGIWAAGAISNPIVPIYREHELRSVLEALRPACVVTALSFRGHDHAEMWSDVCADLGLGDSARVVVRGAAVGWTDFDTALGDAPLLDQSTDPDDPALIVLTSGTTSGAKSVVHSTRTMLSVAERFWRWSSYG